MWRCRLAELNWVSTKMRSMPACRLLEMGTSMSRNLPATGTAGLARSRVSGHSRAPWPPPRMAVTTSRIAPLRWALGPRYPLRRPAPPIAFPHGELAQAGTAGAGQAPAHGRRHAAGARSRRASGDRPRPLRHPPHHRRRRRRRLVRRGLLPRAGPGLPDRDPPPPGARHPGRPHRSRRPAPRPPLPPHRLPPLRRGGGGRPLPGAPAPGRGLRPRGHRRGRRRPASAGPTSSPCSAPAPPPTRRPTPSASWPCRPSPWPPTGTWNWPACGS